MKTVEPPSYFSTLHKGKTTLYIRKEYEHRLSSQDLDALFNLHNDADRLNASYHGRIPCRNLLLKSLYNESLVVRQYWHGGLFGRILRDYFLDGLRPLRELSVCEAAAGSGIKTTEIVAIVKSKILGPLYKCQLVSKEITGAVDLMELLLHTDCNRFLSQKRQIIKKLAGAVKDMHDAGIYHADLHLKNILVRSAGGGQVDVYIIDLDKSRQYEGVSLRRRMANIMRMNRSLEKFKRGVRKGIYPSLESAGGRNGIVNTAAFPEGRLITNADKMRFLREYVDLCNKTGLLDSCSLKKFMKGPGLHLAT